MVRQARLDQSGSTAWFVPAVQRTINMKHPIKAISYAIELKPGKKYLLVFKSHEGMALGRSGELMAMLRKEGITGIGIVLRKGDNLEAIEAV